MRGELEREEKPISLSFLKGYLPPSLEEKLPGLILTAVISALAIYTSAQVSYVSPLIAAMGIGMIIRNFFIVPNFYFPGIFYSMRQVLRLGIILLGSKITLDKVLGLGWEALLVPTVALITTLIVTIFLGKLFGLTQKMSLLLGMGTSICGASAVLIGGSLTKSKEADIIVSISAITVFGTLSMLLYPVIFKLEIFPLTLETYGVWVGSSVHEVAQVVTAGFSVDKSSGEVAVLVKLVRVILLIPLAFVLSLIISWGAMEKRESRSSRVITFPLFLIGFAGMVILNSLEFFTPKALKWMEFTALFLLLMGMAGMGLETDFRRLLKIGFRPFFVGLLSTFFISGISLLLIVLLK
ncbi:MAG: YeiH family protein [Caldimicrobium sp.]|nr:YeiH family protein [Caldimicrobium sp.]MCX7873262.1 YeiH family protein [Caldimicrobium sp.]MDW8094718.1 YeiH family protein [Caldimicrobium sp.]